MEALHKIITYLQFGKEIISEAQIFNLIFYVSGSKFNIQQFFMNVDSMNYKLHKVVIEDLNFLSKIKWITSENKNIKLAYIISTLGS